MCRYRWTGIVHHTVKAGEMANTAEMAERVELVTSSSRHLLQ